MSKKTAINRIDLGMTRIAGYTLYDEVSREFQETTPKEVKDLINRGQVNGLKLVDGEIELDKDVFCMSNLMVKSAVGKYRTLYPTTSIVNCMYAVVRVIETDNGRLYEIINNKCARVKVTPEKLKILMEIGYVAGVKMGACGEIELCKGVTIEDKRTKPEQFESITQTEVKEHEQSLPDINIEEEKDLTVEGNEKSAEKSVESVADESDTPVEQEDNSSEIVFDSLDVPEVHADGNTISDDMSTPLDNTEVNEGDSPSKEQVEEKKTTTPRKNKKK
ncbi:hypothetical protein [Caloramator quimbayensis]|nr:hypothetical protein [Caloramator quimbayensis]